jgi:hypothetical protein
MNLSRSENSDGENILNMEVDKKYEFSYNLKNVKGRLDNQ